jgi:hypothetical protein
MQKIFSVVVLLMSKPTLMIPNNFVYVRKILGKILYELDIPLA